MRKHWSVIVGSDDIFENPESFAGFVGIYSTKYHAIQKALEQSELLEDDRFYVFECKCIEENIYSRKMKKIKKFIERIKELIRKHIHKG